MMTERTMMVANVTSNGTRQAYPHGCDVDHAGAGPDNRDVFVGSGIITSVKATTSDNTDVTEVRVRIYDCSDADGRAIRGGNEAAVEDRHPYVIDTTAGGALLLHPQTGSPFVGGSSAQGNSGRLLHDIQAVIRNGVLEFVNSPVHCFMGMYVRLDAINQPALTRVDFQITYLGDISGAVRKAARNFPSQIGGNIPL